jgi:lipopolysaccharide/colanic/teichoic acid biosynthesis glycosyltransferase/glycosyltransferase involved in cell wall biosynthesis
MRVLHLVKTSVGARWALRQMRELVANGVDVHVALPPGGPLVQGYREAGVAVHTLQTSLPVRAPWRWPGLFRGVRRLVHDVAPDLIHSHFVGTTLTMRLALGGDHPIPRVFQVPGPLHLEHPAFRALDLRSAGPADRWVGSCRWTCERYLASGIPEDRVFLSYYGSCLRELGRGQAGRLRQILGADPGARLVGMVSYMYRPKRYLGQTRGLKGHEDLIDALALCRSRDPRIVGVFIGGAWDGAAAYEARVRRYGASRLGDAARFLGTRGDVPELYPDLDVVAHPSHSENLGGAAESLLLGVPTIATRVGGFPDLVRPGETGWLVPPRDPAALAEAILDALDDPEKARRMAERGRERAREMLDVRETARGVLGIYRDVLARESAAGRPTSTATAEPPGGRPSDSPRVEVLAAGPRSAGPSTTIGRAVGRRPHRFSGFLKRALDVSGALVGILLFALPMLAIAAAVAATMGRPVLFRQRRAGLRGEPFTLLKFRTMRDAFGPDGRPLPDEERLTHFGLFLRRTSLDELPQLWNVLRGDLSLVGPRPLLLDYLPLYSEHQARRHEVRPGLTGLAQIRGRNSLTWEQRFDLDVWYVDHQSLGLDLRILMQTVLKVLRQEGISGQGSSTMLPFRGPAGGAP